MKEIVRLAKQKGFNASTVTTHAVEKAYLYDEDNYNHKSNVFIKLINEGCNYLYLCELQRWIRDIQNIHIRVDNVNHPHEGKWYFEIQHLPSGIENLWDEDAKVYDSYKIALEEGIMYALKIVNQ